MAGTQKEENKNKNNNQNVECTYVRITSLPALQGIEVGAEGSRKVSYTVFAWSCLSLSKDRADVPFRPEFFVVCF